MIVTISRLYGAAALEVAHELGDILGYQVVGENFSKIVGASLGTTEEDVERVDLRAPSLSEWILDHLGSATGLGTRAQGFEQDVRREIESAVLDAAAKGDVVIFGGVSNMILRDRKDTVSVFLHAPLSYRVGRLQTSGGIGFEEATKEMQRIENSQRRWAKTHYGIEWGESWYYDIAIDVMHLGITGAARLIASTVRELERARPPIAERLAISLEEGETHAE